MACISIVIPTYNRPEFLRRAIESVLAQSFQDYEVIVVDDGDKISAESIVKGFSDPRLRYIKHHFPKQGGSVARNSGIREAISPFVAFLDDDDTWELDKLEKQYGVFVLSTADVGFSFTGIKKIGSDGTTTTGVEEGVHDLSIITLTRFKGYMTSTLMIKKNVFDAVGFFDETLPSHQEAELVLRMAQRFKGLGINAPLSTVDMLPHEHIGGDIERRIKGRELLLQKHLNLFSHYPNKLAKHYFWIGLWYREIKKYQHAKEYFKKSFIVRPSAHIAFHLLLVSFSGFLYKILKPYLTLQKNIDSSGFNA